MGNLGVRQYDIVTLQNIDSEDFIFEYDRSAGNPPYVIPAGEVKRFPRFLAEHALKHLIDKILTKKKERINNDVARQDLASQIVIDEETFQTPSQKSDAEKQREMVEELNKPSELDTILAKHRKKEDKVETSVQVEDQPIKPQEKFEGLEEPLKGDEIDTTEVAPPPSGEVKAMPTRNEIYEYAQNVLKLTFDEKTKAKFDNMKVADLISEIGDPREEIE